jgi:hypothetical protein
MKRFITGVHRSPGTLLQHEASYQHLRAKDPDRSNTGPIRAFFMRRKSPVYAINALRADFDGLGETLETIYHGFMGNYFAPCWLTSMLFLCFHTAWAPRRHCRSATKATALASQEHGSGR